MKATTLKTPTPKEVAVEYAKHELAIRLNDETNLDDILSELYDAGFEDAKSEPTDWDDIGQRAQAG